MSTNCYLVQDDAVGISPHKDGNLGVVEGPSPFLQGKLWNFSQNLHHVDKKVTNVYPWVKEPEVAWNQMISRQIQRGKLRFWSPPGEVVGLPESI